jgi:outer membrane protein assembly factor BamB
VAGDGLVFVNTGFMKPQLWALRTGALPQDVERVVWKARRSIPSMSSPLLFDGRLYLVSDGGVAACLDAASGAELWRERLDGEYSASPILAAGRLYFCSRDGLTSVIRPGETFELLGENRLDEGFMASPAVVGDALILRTRTHVYRIEQQ